MIALSLARLAGGLGGSIVIVVLPLSVHELPAGALGAGLAEATRVGLVISAFGLALALFQPLVGRFADGRFSLKSFVVVGLGLFGVATVGLHGAVGYEQLLALRASQGAALALTIPTSIALIAALAPPDRRGFALGFYGTARMVGFASGPLVGGALLTIAEPDTVYLFAAVPAAVAVGVIGLGVRGPARSTTELEGSEAAPATGEDGSDPGGRAPSLVPFVMLGSGFFILACCVSSLVVLEREFMERLDQTTLGFGAAVSALIATRLVLDWPIGHLSDRVARRPLLVVGLVLLAIGTTACGVARSTVELVACRGFMGIGMAFFSTPCFALAADLAERGGRGGTFRLSILTSGFGFGLAVGPLATGLLAARAGFLAPFLALGALTLIAAPVMPFLVEEPPRHAR